MPSLRPQRRALQRLYAQIPTFECVPGCTDCCGPVPVAAAEGERAPKLVGFLESLKPGDCLDCPYSAGGNCEVYEDRPFICRLYGTAPEEPRLRCPHGRKPDKPLSAARAAALTMEYQKIMEAWDA